MAPKFTFTDLTIAHMGINNIGISRYKVYSNAEEFAEVEADTASDAISKSNIATPYKVVHIVPELTKITDISMLNTKQPVEQPTNDSQANQPAGE